MNYTQKIIDEISQIVQQFSEDEVNKLVDDIKKSKSIFVAGQGRSGFMIKSFAMRLMHIGFDVHVLGETTTPSIIKDDLLIIASGSGETASLVNNANKAKIIGSAVSLITIDRNSTIAQNSDSIVVVNAQSKGQTTTNTIQPMGSLFEQSILILFDSIILQLMDEMKKDGSNMYLKHANLE